MATDTKAGDKRRFNNCKLKAFVFGDGTFTSNWRQAVVRFNAGIPTRMLVRTEDKQVETENITQMISRRGKKFIETEKDVYEMRGVEPQKKVSEVRFFVQGSSRTFSSKNTMEVARVISLLDLGCEIGTEVFFKNGTSHKTSNILELDLIQRRLITEDLSVYRW